MLYRNTAFQFIGRGTSLIAGLLSVPIFFHFLGTETYGVVGIYISLMSLSGLFDLGLPVSANRQISIMRSNGQTQNEISRVIRSIEVVVIVLGFFIFFIVWATAPFIAHTWLNLVTLKPKEVELALQLAGLAIALRFPISFYNNCLFAFDCHGRSNLISALAAVARVAIPLILFLYSKPSLEGFFLSQIIVNGGESFASMLMTWRQNLSFFSRPASMNSIRPVLNMTLGLTGISLTALLLSQLDKIILSRYIPLDVFSVYSVAFSLAMGMLPIGYAIGNASFPAINQYVAKRQKSKLQSLIQKIILLDILFILPIACVFIFFSERLGGLFHYFSNDSKDIISYLSLLSIGAFAQCFTIILSSVRIAQGKPNGLFLINLSALPLFSILYLAVLPSSGIEGFCYIFIFFNLYILFMQFFLHMKEIGYRDMWITEAKFVFFPLFTTFLLSYTFDQMVPILESLAANIITVLVSLCVIAIMQIAIFKKKWKDLQE